MIKQAAVPLFPLGLWNVGWRYLVVRRWQSLLMVLGIALGVAVMVAIDLANASASQAFQLSTESITGKATHQIVGTLLVTYPQFISLIPHQLLVFSINQSRHSRLCANVQPDLAVAYLHGIGA